MLVHFTAFQVRYDGNQLSRSLLQESGKGEFDENIGSQIVQFLERQAQPACLIAHNGAKFDYPILSRKLASARVGIPDIRCGDSLAAFRDVEPECDSHRLVDLYENAFGSPPENCHNAEFDAIAMMKVVVNGGPELWNWFDRNAMKKLKVFKDMPFPRW